MKRRRRGLIKTIRRKLGRWTNERTRSLSIGFVEAWLGSRNHQEFWLGLPAIVIALVSLVVVVIGLIPKAQEPASFYHQRAAGARQANQQALAKLYLQRAVERGVVPPEMEYQQALDHYEQGRIDETLRIMQRLAPNDQLGYQPAHEWLLGRQSKELAKNLNIERPTDSEIQERDRLSQAVEQQGKLLLSADAMHLEANVQLAKIYRRAVDFAAASIHFSRAVDRREDLRLDYAKVLETQNRQDEAKREARLAANYYAKQLSNKEVGAEQTSNGRLMLADAYLQSGDYRQAARTLLLGGALESSQQKNLMTEILVRWAKSLEYGGADVVVWKTKLLDQAIKLRSDHPQLAAAIADLCSDPKTGAQATEALEQLLSSGLKSCAAHFSLAMRAFELRNELLTKSHMRQAYEIEPSICFTVTTLSSVVIERHGPVRALSLIDQALEIDPKNPEFRQTRGLVLMQMKRWRDAISELEYAIIHFPKRVSTLQALANAYEAGGHQDTADIYHQMAKQASTEHENVVGTSTDIESTHETDLAELQDVLTTIENLQTSELSNPLPALTD